MPDLLKALKDLDTAALVENGRLLRVTLSPNAFNALAIRLDTMAEYRVDGPHPAPVIRLAGPGGYIEVHHD